MVEVCNGLKAKGIEFSVPFVPTVMGLLLSLPSIGKEHQYSILMETRRSSPQKGTL